MAGIRYKGQIFSGVASVGDADEVAYDNTQSGLAADNVQEAIDELNSKFTTVRKVTPTLLSNLYVSSIGGDLRKCGRIVQGTITFQMTATPLDAWTAVTFGKLPTDFPCKPITELNVNVISDNGKWGMLTITPNGDLSLNGLSSGVPAHHAFRTPVAYIAATS